MYYEIVPMDRSHLEQIAQLEKACFSTPWTYAMLEEELYNPHASFIVADDGEGGVLGYAGLHVVLDEGYIDNVAVEQAARRHGVTNSPNLSANTQHFPARAANSRPYIHTITLCMKPQFIVLIGP